ncbi:hypothetical protein Plec18167_002707, partial [Paecilomyces lecythidis]
YCLRHIALSSSTLCPDIILSIDIFLNTAMPITGTRSPHERTYHAVQKVKTSSKVFSGDVFERSISI